MASPMVRAARATSVAEERILKIVVSLREFVRVLYLQVRKAVIQRSVRAVYCSMRWK